MDRKEVIRIRWEFAYLYVNEGVVVPVVPSEDQMLDMFKRALDLAHENEEPAMVNIFKTYLEEYDEQR